MEFYIALLAMNHPAQVSLLIKTYFQTLGDFNEYMVPNNNDHHPSSKPIILSFTPQYSNGRHTHTHYTVVSSHCLSIMCSDVSLMHFVAYFFLYLLFVAGD
mmetsp:Transcript_4861/g.5029  ORF Transcript_4861/g.5029 Transcript_4861/m.5029 type:complete len:101 (-) Transcript_4861:10-312(-)